MLQKSYIPNRLLTKDINTYIIVATLLYKKQLCQKKQKVVDNKINYLYNRLHKLFF